VLLAATLGFGLPLGVAAGGLFVAGMALARFLKASSTSGGGSESSWSRKKTKTEIGRRKSGTNKTCKMESKKKAQTHVGYETTDPPSI